MKAKLVHAVLVGGAFSAIGGSGPASAQLSCPCIVFDIEAEVNTAGTLANSASTLVQEVSQVQSWVTQLQQMEAQLTQAQTLFNHLNQLTNPNQFATLLSNPTLRQFLPTDASQVGNLVQSGNGQFDQLNQQAQTFRSSNRSYTPTTPANTYDQFRQATFENTGNTIATAITHAQAIYQTATTRLQGLEQLRLQLDFSTDQKQSIDLAARIAAEQADIQNDVMRLHGLEMQMNMQLAGTREQGEEMAHQMQQDFRSFLGAQ